MADRQQTFPRKNRVPSDPRWMREPRSSSVERSQRASERRPTIYGDATHEIFDGVCFHRPGTIATRSVEVIGIMVAFVAYNHTLAYVFSPIDGKPIPSSNAVIWSLGIYFSADLIWSVVSCNELFWKFKSMTYCVSRGSVVKDSYYRSLLAPWLQLAPCSIPTHAGPRVDR